LQLWTHLGLASLTHGGGFRGVAAATGEVRLALRITASGVTAQNDQLVEQAIIAEQAATIAQKDKQLAELAAVII